MNEPAGFDGGGGGAAGGSGRWIGGAGDGLASKRGEAGVIDAAAGGSTGGAAEGGGVIDPKTCVKPAGSADGFGIGG